MLVCGEMQELTLCTSLPSASYLLHPCRRHAVVRNRYFLKYPGIIRNASALYIAHLIAQRFNESSEIELELYRSAQTVTNVSVQGVLILLDE